MITDQTSVLLLDTMFDNNKDEYTNKEPNDELHMWTYDWSSQSEVCTDLCQSYAHAETLDHSEHSDDPNPNTRCRHTAGHKHEHSSATITMPKLLFQQASSPGTLIYIRIGSSWGRGLMNRWHDFCATDVGRRQTTPPSQTSDAVQQGADLCPINVAAPNALQLSGNVFCRVQIYRHTKPQFRE